MSDAMIDAVNDTINDQSSERPDNLPTVLLAENLGKTYQQGRNEVPVLAGIDLSVHKNERLAIVGSSGSGKSTLLHLLGGLDAPSAGRVLLMGKNYINLGEAARGAHRNLHLGFIYQFHHLLAEFSALENVAMPLLIRRTKREEALERAEQCLRDVGLGHRLTHRPGELSGGERQRAAIARALVTRPACILADEPTGNLDRQTAAQVFDLMLQLNAELGMALILVTHDHDLAKRTGQVCVLEDGRLR